MPLAHARGTARKKDAREHRNVDAEVLLVQEPVLRGNFDVAQPSGEAKVRWLAVAHRNDGSQLKVLRAAIVEIQAALAADSLLRARPVGKRIDFPVAIVRRLWSVQDKWRRCPGGTGPQKK